MQPKKIEKINAHFSLVRGEMSPQQQQAAALAAAFYLLDAPRLQYFFNAARRVFFARE